MAIYSKSQDIYSLALVANRPVLARTGLHYFITYLLLLLLLLLVTYYYYYYYYYYYLLTITITITITYLLLGETGPLLKWDEGKKAVSAVDHSFLLPYRAHSGFALSIVTLRYSKS